MRKLTRKQADEALAQGKTVGAIPSLLSPHFNEGVFLLPLKSFTITDVWIKAFKYYNCNKETGNGISWYLIE